MSGSRSRRAAAGWLSAALLLVLCAGFTARRPVFGGWMAPIEVVQERCASRSSFASTADAAPLTVVAAAAVAAACMPWRNLAGPGSGGPAPRGP